MRTTLLAYLLSVPVLLPAQNYLKTTVTQRYFNGIKRNLEAAADAMPAEKYDFKPTAGQMSFAEWLNHSTERNYSDCAALKGEPAPDAAKGVSNLKTKADVTKALKESLAYCAAAIDGIDDQKVLASQQLTSSLLHTVVHNNEIYGNLAVYMRVSGIVPPSTASRTNQKK
jgi:uncharacterized damage-inducible protein DinB